MQTDRMFELTSASTDIMPLEGDEELEGPLDGLDVGSEKGCPLIKLGSLEGKDEGGVEGDHDGPEVGAAKTLGEPDDEAEGVPLLKLGLLEGDEELGGPVDGSDDGSEEGFPLIKLGTLEGKDGVGAVGDPVQLIV
jgi:hypothetical protein